MTAREPIRTSDAPPPAGSYSQAIRHQGLVWLAGQTPRTSDGARLNDSSFEVQARQALQNTEAVAVAAGTSLQHAVSVTVYLRDPEDRTEFDDLWRDFVTVPYPARAIVQSDLPGFDIEISAVCAIPE
ncbi:RidA family protein [Mycolicibacterium sediminis]|uniref:Enamine deaminase RidA n=1 Tax=Mycolicibacterium sediminis TaxID=1286180 RepID=A0A7I7QRC7_9MYCO|nr:RidA family protein [Mycolicibacterium sediminis]BBY28949.1 enamine deaminase RidA [Mycolicibacterium sediminis]